MSIIILSNIFLIKFKINTFNINHYVCTIQIIPLDNVPWNILMINKFFYSVMLDKIKRYDDINFCILCIVPILIGKYNPIKIKITATSYKINFYFDYFIMVLIFMIKKYFITSYNVDNMLFYFLFDNYLIESSFVRLKTLFLIVLVCF